jgi:hypothetical protein
MATNDIRSQFRTFAGEERFRQLIFLAVNTVGTDSFPACDDELWRSFRTKCPAAPTEAKDIREMFLWCHVHERQLLTDQLSQPALDASTLAAITHIARISEWYDAAAEAFPHGHGGLDVICPECVARHLEWLAANPNWNTP